jgi:hypothetical protein
VVVDSSVALLGQNTEGTLIVGIKILPEEGPTAREN